MKHLSSLSRTRLWKVWNWHHGSNYNLGQKLKRTENIKLCSKVSSVGRICNNLSCVASYAMSLYFSRRGHEATSCPIYFDLNEKLYDIVCIKWPECRQMTEGIFAMTSYAQMLQSSLMHMRPQISNHSRIQQVPSRHLEKQWARTEPHNKATLMGQIRPTAGSIHPGYGTDVHL